MENLKTKAIEKFEEEKSNQRINQIKYILGEIERCEKRIKNFNMEIEKIENGEYESNNNPNTSGGFTISGIALC